MPWTQAEGLYRGRGRPQISARRGRNPGRQGRSLVEERRKAGGRALRLGKLSGREPVEQEWSAGDPVPHRQLARNHAKRGGRVAVTITIPPQVVRPPAST